MGINFTEDDCSLFSGYKLAAAMIIYRCCLYFKFTGFGFIQMRSMIFLRDSIKSKVEVVLLILTKLDS